MSDNGNGNGRLTYRTYRYGRSSNLAALIGPALADFRDRYGCLPAGVAVHKALVGKAQAALDDLGVIIPVAGCGGVLVGECWLQVVARQTALTPGAGQEATQRSNGGPPSMLARVAAAQAAMTPERARQLVLQLEVAR